VTGESLVGSFVDDDVSCGVKTVEDPPFTAGSGGGRRKSEGY